MSETMKRDDAVESDVLEKTQSDQAPDEPHDHYLHGAKLAFCIAAINMVNFLGALDTTVAMTIQSAIVAQFKNSYGSIGWLNSGFVLPAAALTMLWGRAAMVVGRRMSIFVSIVIFELGSLICALSKSMGMLIVGRVVAGIGGAGLQSISYLIVNDIVPLENRALATTFITLGYIVASVVGPLIGGGFASSSSATWRWAFYINLPIGGVALVAMAFAYRQKAANEWQAFKTSNWSYKVLNLDLPGAALITSGLTLVLLALSFGGNQFPWNSAAVIVCFTVGGVLLVAFCVFEFVIYDWLVTRTQTKDTTMFPLLSLVIVKDYRIMAGMMSIMVECISFFILCISLVTYFEIVLGYSTLNSSLYLLSPIIACTLSSVVSGLTISKTGFLKPISVGGAICGAVGTGTMLLLGTNSNDGYKIGLTILPGLAYGLISIPNLIGSQLAVKEKDPQLLNIVTTMFAFMRAVGSSIGSNLTTALFTAVANSKKGHFSSLQQFTISELMAPSDSGISLSTQQNEATRKLFMQAMHGVTYASLAFSCVLVVLSMFTTNKRVKSFEAKESAETDK